MTGESGGGGWGSGWPTDDPDQAAHRPRPPEPPTPLHALPTRIVPSLAHRGPQPSQTSPGAGQPPPEHRLAQTPRRRRKPMFALLALLVLALTAGSLALPDVANRLELPWAPNAPTGPEPSPIAVQREIRGPQDGKPPTKQGVTAALREAAGDPALGSLSGSVVDPESGEVLWEQDASRPLPPASTTKLLTAAAALLSLEHTDTLTTTVVQGDEPGSVVLVGGGDPTLTGLPKGKDSLYPGAGRLDDLAAQVRKATGGKVDQVQVDLGAFAGNTRGPGWAPEDAPSTYAAPVQAAMLDGGRSNPDDPNSERVGNPAAALAERLAERLDAEAGPTDVTAAPDAEVLGKVRSAPMTELVDVMLGDSDNVLAEAVARQVALAAGKEPSFTGAADAVQEVLREAGFTVDGVELSDGSGLSEDNRIPAGLLTEVLAAAAGDGEHAAKLRPLLGGLPVAGGTGTLAGRYTEGGSKQAKGWVRAKTGTLSDVNTLAGVVLDREGAVLVFALMSSGTNPADARPALDDVAAALRSCGCR